MNSENKEREIPKAKKNSKTVKKKKITNKEKKESKIIEQEKVKTKPTEKVKIKPKTIKKKDFGIKAESEKIQRTFRVSQTKPPVSFRVSSHKHQGDILYRFRQKSILDKRRSRKKEESK